jgi:hypothetical protein
VLLTIHFPECVRAAGALHQTVNPDETVALSADEGVGAHFADTVSLEQLDLNACAPDAVLHTIRTLLKPKGLTLPKSADPRTPTEEGVPLSSQQARVVFLWYSSRLEAPSTELEQNTDPLCTCA